MVYQLESPDITTIIDYCEDLLKDEKIEVYDFGKIKDLVLHIYVDEDFAWMFAGHECLARNTFWISLGYSF